MTWITVICIVLIAICAIAYVIASVIFAQFFKRDKDPGKTNENWYAYWEKQGRRDVAEASANFVKRLEEYPCEEFMMQSGDGVTLCGHYYKNENSDKIAILCHGFHGTKVGLYGVFDCLYFDGKCDVLIIDQRAHGKSGGKYITYGGYEQHDVCDWCSAVAKAYPEKKIILYGVSMGGTAALLAASSKDMTKNLACVISDCGFSSMLGTFHRKMSKKIGFFSWIVEPFLWRICVKRAKFDPLYIDVPSHIYSICVPVLFIHGDCDELVPISEGRKNYDACPTKKNFVTSHGSKHGTNFYFAPDECKKAINELLAEI